MGGGSRNPEATGPAPSAQADPNRGHSLLAWFSTSVGGSASGRVPLDGFRFFGPSRRSCIPARGPPRRWTPRGTNEVLILDEGEVISGSSTIARWAKKNPILERNSSAGASGEAGKSVSTASIASSSPGSNFSKKTWACLRPPRSPAAICRRPSTPRNISTSAQPGEAGVTPAAEAESPRAAPARRASAAPRGR